MRGFIDRAAAADSLRLRVAAVHGYRSLFEDYSEEQYIHDLMDVMDVPSEPAKFAERLGNMFLDDLKAGTPWVVKVANIEIMLLRRFTKAGIWS